MRFFSSLLAVVVLSLTTPTLHASGEAWFVDASGPTLARVDAAGSVETVSSLPGDAFAIAATGPSSAWLALTSVPTVLHIASDGALLSEIALPAPATSLALDSRGRLWVVLGTSDEVRRYGADGTLERVVPVGSVPYGIAVDRRGVVWVTNAWGNSVTRIERDGSTVEIPVGFYPTGITAHPDGTIWVVEKEHVAVLGEDGSYRRLNAGASPRGVTVAADGSVWVTNQSSHSVTRFRRSGKVSDEYSVGLLPWGISATSDGSVVVLCRISGEVWRLASSGSLIGVTELDGGAGYPHSFGDLSGITAALVHHPEEDADGDAVTNAYESAVGTDLFDAGSAPTPFVRGDLDGDGVVTGSDAARWFGDEGPCSPAADFDDDGDLDDADLIALLTYLFSGGVTPTTPFPVAGWDPTPGLLGCEASAP